MKPQNYFVYILTNPDRHTVRYTGITNDLERRLNEHSLNRGSRFAEQYNATKVIYFEAFPDAESAIGRETQLKNWSRKKKEELFAKQNPDWQDLISEMYSFKRK